MAEDDRERAARLIGEARAGGRRVLTEHDAKRVLSCYGIPVTREVLVASRQELSAAVASIGYPLAMKASSSEIPHKTEQGLLRLDLRTESEALRAFDEIATGMAGAQGGVLIQEMVPGRRELAAGLVRDADFGPCVMFGLGGIFTEILEDVVFAKAPLDEAEALAMMRDIKGGSILDAVRGIPAADRGELAGLLIALGRIGLDHEAVEEIDLNPVILAGSRPIVADALIVLR
jgi:succinyl-CoA synthetase beta subunit